jgi:large subunit ribosomal protein L35
MQKTKKSIAKRFKLTAKGKLVRRTPGFRHLLGAKSTKQKRRASRDKLVAVTSWWPKAMPSRSSAPYRSVCVNSPAGINLNFLRG